jgi:hypothetical protein
VWCRRLSQSRAIVVPCDRDNIKQIGIAVQSCYVALAPIELELKGSRRIVLGVDSIKLPRHYISRVITNTSWTYDVWSHASKMKMYSCNNLK